MNCPNCQSPMVLAQATNFGDKYHYCRTCKKELSELTPTEAVVSRDTGLGYKEAVAQSSRSTFIVYGSNSPCTAGPGGNDLHYVPYQGLRCTCGSVTT